MYLARKKDDLTIEFQLTPGMKEHNRMKSNKKAVSAKIIPLLESTEKRGGVNPPNTSNLRPPKPGGSKPKPTTSTGGTSTGSTGQTGGGNNSGQAGGG